jgi:hypothetical protein
MDDPEETSSFLKNESTELETIGGNNRADSVKDIRTELVCVKVLFLKCPQFMGEYIIVEKGSSRCRMMIMRF